jgi:Ca-activated chloride channel family protein
LGTDDLSLQARSYYNRGNSQFFIGASAAAKDKEQALKQWGAAEKSFEAALKLEPEDKAAAHNLEMVKKKLEQLKEEMRKSGKQCDNPQDGKDGEQKKDGKQDKQENKQGKQEQQQDGDKQQSSDQQKDQDQQEKQGDQNGSPGEKQAGADQEAAENQEQEAKHKTVPEPEKKEEAPAPTAEDIQKAAAVQEEQQGKQDKQEKEEGGQMSAEDMERRMMGKMTEQEAKNLLNSLKGEQGELNFIPQGTGNDEPVDKDW